MAKDSNIPMPDPTVLTTKAFDRAKENSDQVDKVYSEGLHRELALRQEQRKTDIEHLAKRIRGSSKNDRLLFKSELRIVETELKAERRISSLIEDQRKERKEDDRISLSAALAAAEKARVADTQSSDRANTKTELSTTEQLKLQQANAATANQGTVTLLNTLQTRVERMENLKQGAADQTNESHARQSNMGLWIGLVVALFMGTGGLVLTAIGIAVTYIITSNK